MQYQGRMKREKFSLAKQMRKNPTPAEKHLWSLLQPRPNGKKWRRQHPVLGYIVDFYCASMRLVIEVDGSSHKGREEYDEKRDKALKHFNFTVVRMSNEQAFSMTEQHVDKWLNGPACFLPFPQDVVWLVEGNHNI